VLASETRASCDSTIVVALTAGTVILTQGSLFLITMGNWAVRANASTSLTERAKWVAGIATLCCPQSRLKPRLLASILGSPGSMVGMTKLPHSVAACSATKTAASSSVGSRILLLPNRWAIRDNSSTRTNASSRPVVGNSTWPVRNRENA
jgi:hypothetical protein